MESPRLMSEGINRILLCVERGKVDAASPYPPDLRGQDGADELTKQALAEGAGPDEILSACDEGMRRIGDRFGAGKAFVPELLMSAKAMKAAMAHLKPFFASGQVQAKGIFVVGTVAGDLHDIGKNLVAMVAEGGGWEIVDIGIDAKPQKFLDAIANHPGCVVGLSALLTTTMANMEKTVKEIKASYPDCPVLVGGAPLNAKIAEKMGADGYGKDARQALVALSAFSGRSAGSRDAKRQ
jgi:5-methyltetrahydrofolate--homocysteine methyltransferase